MSASVAADGLDISSDRALEAKFVMTVDNTLWDLQKPAVLHRDVYFEFFRYGEILRDPCVPVETLQVRVSDEVAVEFFVDALSRFAVPGEVVVVP